jgi:hypothetical protein
LSDIIAAPTKDDGAFLLPKMDGNVDGIDPVVLPGNCCKGVLYARIKFAYDVDGICPVELFEVDIFDFASVILYDEEVSFAISPFNKLILLFKSLNSVSRFLTPLKYVLEDVRLKLP